MLLITCPFCGPRDETEYHYGGEAHVPYPADPASLTDEEWARYLFYRANPKGQFAERWVHSSGCRKWFNAVRDTVTYRILATYKAGEARPASGGKTSGGDRPTSPDPEAASANPAQSHPVGGAQ